jgi:hypothetical protein
MSWDSIKLRLATQYLRLHDRGKFALVVVAVAMTQKAIATLGSHIDGLIGILFALLLEALLRGNS